MARTVEQIMIDAGALMPLDQPTLSNRLQMSERLCRRLAQEVGALEARLKVGNRNYMDGQTRISREEAIRRWEVEHAINTEVD